MSYERVIRGVVDRLDAGDMLHKGQIVAGDMLDERGFRDARTGDQYGPGAADGFDDASKNASSSGAWPPPMAFALW